MPAVGAGSVNLHQRTRDQADRNVESKWAQRQGRVEGGMVREGQLPRDRYVPAAAGAKRLSDCSARSPSGTSRLAIEGTHGVARTRPRQSRLVAKRGGRSASFFCDAASATP